MPADAEINLTSSGGGTGHSRSDPTEGSASKLPAEAPESKRSASKSKVESPPDEHLQKWLIVWGKFWLAVLVGLSVVGWLATEFEVNRQYSVPPSAATPSGTATPTATLTETVNRTATPSPATSPAATQAVVAAQRETPTDEANVGDTPAPTPSAPATPTVAGAQVSPTPTPTPTPPTPTPTPIPTPSLEAAKVAARQHFVTLAVLIATMVLFPWALLLAFAFQRAPRLYRDLKHDLKALGLYRDPEEKKRNLEESLAPRFLPSLQSTEQEVAVEYAKKLSMYALGRSSGFGGLRPSEIAPSAWKAAYEKAEEVRLGKPDPDLEKALTEKVKLGLEQSRERVATRYARQLVERAVKGERDAGPAPERISAHTDVWDQAFIEALDDAGLIRDEISAEETKIGVKQRFGVPEFLLPLQSMTPIVLVSFVWALWPEAISGFGKQMAASASLNDYFGVVVTKMAPAGVAVITGYLFMMLGLMRRYHRSDITPGAYWEVLNRLIVVFLLALVGSVLFPHTTALALGIVAGIFPVDTLRFIVKAALSRTRKFLARKKTKADEDLAKRLEKQHPLSLLDDLDPWDELRLTEEGIIGIQGMATADIAHLLIWTPFTTHQIVDWVDQSILFLAAGAEPDAHYVRTFRKMGLRGVSDLIDATQTAADRKRVVAAAKAVQKTLPKDPQDASEDPVSGAQRAAADLEPKVKDAQERVSQVKDKKKDDPLDAATRTVITSAMEGIRDARKSIDSVVALVKSGGESLAAALEAANSLQAKLKSAGDKVVEVEDALSTAKEKVTEDLATKLAALSVELTGEPDANSRAQALLDAVNEIAKPLATTEAKARDFAKKAEAIQKKAETIQTDVPGDVGEAETTLNSLTALAQDALKRIKATPAQANAVGSVDDLVRLLTDDSTDRPKSLIAELKKKDDWIAAGEGNKAKSHRNAGKLVGQTAEILEHLQAAGVMLEEEPASANEVVDSLPLTEDVLVTLLNGLERNPNLRRILRYLTSEVLAVPAPGPYTPNKEWLDAPQPEKLKQA